MINYRFDDKNSTNELFRRSDYMMITQEKMNANRQILHKLQMSLRKKKFNKEIYNAHITMLTALKSVNSFNSDKKNEIFLKLNAISIKMKESEILMTLRFNTLISVVYFKKTINEI